MIPDSDQPLPARQPLDETVAKPPLGPEKLTKYAVIFLAVLYGVGAVVTNVFFASVEIAEFNPLKGRYILTGLGSLVTYIAPLGVVVVLSLVFGCKATKDPLPFVLAGVAGVVAAMLPITAFSFAFAEPSGFWPLYIQGDSQYSILRMCILATVLGSLGIMNILSSILRDHFQPRNKFGSSLLESIPLSFRLPSGVALFLCGWFASIAPYAYGFHPHIHYSLGGGHPRLVYLYSESISDIPTAGLRRFDRGKDSPDGLTTYILWHETDDFLYLQQFTPNPKYRRCIVVNRGEIAAFEVVGAMFEFEAFPFKIADVTILLPDRVSHQDHSATSPDATPKADPLQSKESGKP